MLTRQERAFEYDYFQLPPVSPSMTTHRWTLCRVPCTVNPARELGWAGGICSFAGGSVHGVRAREGVRDPIQIHHPQAMKPIPEC